VPGPRCRTAVDGATQTPQERGSSCFSSGRRCQAWSSRSRRGLRFPPPASAELLPGDAGSRAVRSPHLEGEWRAEHRPASKGWQNARSPDDRSIPLAPPGYRPAAVRERSPGTGFLRSVKHPCRLDRYPPLADSGAWVELIETSTFTKQITALLSDDEYGAFQSRLAANPQLGTPHQLYAYPKNVATDLTPYAETGLATRHSCQRGVWR